MNLEGSCLCGGVRYRARGPLGTIARCHCSQCRKASGAEFATNAGVDADAFELLAGRELVSEYESSPGSYRCFCRRCGSQLFKRYARNDQVRIRLGTLDTDQAQRPAYHIHVASKPSWSEISDMLPQFEQGLTNQ